MVTVVRVVPGARERLVQITGPGYDNIVQVRSIYLRYEISIEPRHPNNYENDAKHLNNMSIDI